MYDMQSINTRYFKLTFPNGMKLEVEPPKLKVLKKILDIAKVDENDMGQDGLDNLIDALSMALSKNKQGRKITKDVIEEMMDVDQVMSLLNAYFKWVEEIKTSKN